MSRCNRKLRRDPRRGLGVGGFLTWRRQYTGAYLKHTRYRLVRNPLKRNIFNNNYYPLYGVAPLLKTATHYTTNGSQRVHNGFLQYTRYMNFKAYLIYKRPISLTQTGLTGQTTLRKKKSFYKNVFSVRRIGLEPVRPVWVRGNITKLIRYTHPRHITGVLQKPVIARLGKGLQFSGVPPS